MEGERARERERERARERERGRGRERGREHTSAPLERFLQVPSPYTLQCTPYTLHPTPYTLHLTLFTLHPTPYTLHPTPYTRYPTPYTLHPTPHTLHPTLRNPFFLFCFFIALDIGRRRPLLVVEGPARPRTLQRPPRALPAGLHFICKHSNFTNFV